MKFKLLFLNFLAALPLCADAMLMPSDKNLLEASYGTRHIVREALTDYGFNPVDYRIKALPIHLSNTLGGYADDLGKLVVINENMNEDFKIFTAYHEVGHIKDKIKLKTLIASLSTYFFLSLCSWSLKPILSTKIPDNFLFMPCLKYFDFFDLLGFSATTIGSLYAAKKIVERGELTADRLACEKLLAKNRFNVICDALMVQKLNSLEVSSSLKKRFAQWKINHNYAAEYKNMVDFLQKNGYRVDETIGNTATAFDRFGNPIQVVMPNAKNVQIRILHDGNVCATKNRVINIQ